LRGCCGGCALSHRLSGSVSGELLEPSEFEESMERRLGSNDGDMGEVQHSQGRKRLSLKRYIRAFVIDMQWLVCAQIWGLRRRRGDALSAGVGGGRSTRGNEMQSQLSQRYGSYSPGSNELETALQTFGRATFLGAMQMKLTGRQPTWTVARLCRVGASTRSAVPCARDRLVRKHYV
jgi:hypothetical protein